jgi:hypothetical protein
MATLFLVGLLVFVPGDALLRLVGRRSAQHPSARDAGGTR